jgi:monofunctional glycosyltransferase
VALRLLFILTLVLIGLPVLMVGCLRQQPPLVTSFMLQSDVKPVEYEWVDAEDIAEVARKAVIASEDQKFHQHAGFDYEAIEQAYKQNQKRNRKRGASTISQQTAKNLFLWSGGGYVRKGIEAYLTLLIELLWSKERILEVYLNIVELGPGVYGVEAASQKYFGKPASQLTPNEAARLAAVLPNPKRWSAENPGPYVQTRTAWILRQMGYAPRSPSVPDPEPPEPEAEPAEGMEGGFTGSPDSVDEDGDTSGTDEMPEAGDEAPTPGEVDASTGLEDGEGVVTTPLPDSPSPADAPAQQQPVRPRGGGSVIDEEPSDGDAEWEQSLIL